MNQIPRRILTGSFNIVLKRSNTPSTAIPTNRNGSKSSQIIGYKTKTSKAKGQQKRSSNNHKMIFIFVPCYRGERYMNPKHHQV